MTKLDVLDDLEEIPVCVAYRINGKETTEMPATYRGMQAVQPVYRNLPGWNTSTRGVSKLEALPDKARSYIEFLEQQTGIEIGCISTGPERTETVIRTGSKLENLFGIR